MRDALHEGVRKPTRAELVSLAKRAWDAVRAKLQEQFPGTDFIAWEEATKQDREKWIADVRAIWLGGRSVHPLSWVAKIITKTVRND